MKLIVGLGNSGRQYEDTRHNVGTMAVRRLASKYRVHWECRQVHNKFVYGAWSFRQGRVQLLATVPQTTLMMNEYGEALLAATKLWPVASEDLLLVCDDVNLPLGTLRMRPQGSAGGHHGLESCFEAFGTDLVPRLRIGVGIEPLPKDLTEFVLSPFRANERPLIRRAITRAVEACEFWVTHGIHVAMNRTNVRAGG